MSSKYRCKVVPMRWPPATWTNPCPGGAVDRRDEMAILIAMSVVDRLPLADVKNRLSEVVEQVEVEHARVTITKHGRPAAVLISADDLESLEETLALLSDPEVLAQIRASRAEVGVGQRVALTKEQALARIRT
jgi:antitoxin YefM